MKNLKWIIKTFLLTFVVALVISGGSNFIAERSNLFFLIVIMLMVIMCGIIFDIIGTATLTAKEAAFHAKASNKIKGAKSSISLIKSSSSVASFCNDVIGDVCGIVSGTMSAMIAINLSEILSTNYAITALIVSSIVSSMTVGGKAIGKEYAIKKSDTIVFIVGKIVNKFQKNR